MFGRMDELFEYWEGRELQQVHFQIARLISSCDLWASKFSFPK